MDCALQFTWIARALLLSLSLSLSLYGIWLHISIDFPYIPMHISTLQKAMIFQTFSLHVSHLLKYNLGATHWCIRWYIDGVLHWYINAMLTQWKPIIRYLSIHIHGLLYLCYTICYVLSTICTIHYIVDVIYPAIRSMQHRLQPMEYCVYTPAVSYQKLYTSYSYIPYTTQQCTEYVLHIFFDLYRTLNIT